MLRPIKLIRAFAVQCGGEVHSGWLPHGAAVPEPTPRRTVLLDLTISTDDVGYFLDWRAADGKHHGDTWHASLEDALEHARHWFGASLSDWCDCTEA